MLVTHWPLGYERNQPHRSANVGSHVAQRAPNRMYETRRDEYSLQYKYHKGTQSNISLSPSRLFVAKSVHEATHSRYLAVLICPTLKTSVQSESVQT